MKNHAFFFVILLLLSFVSFAQPSSSVLTTKKTSRCLTMEYMEEAIKKDPALPEKWRIEGEKQYKAYLQRKLSGRVESPTATEIIIPIVFHLVDAAATLSGITDRDIYEQVEVLNRDYSGKKADFYRDVIPPEITARVGRISLRFVLARRTPGGALTTGIERRVNTTPNHINIKANASGGLDAWDVNKYVNVWAGSFSGNDLELLGSATFPFTTGEGPQGLAISISTIPFTSNTSRGYYPDYAEGATLSHEIGHYFYLFHTFGDQTTCNNTDFRLQGGWPLPTGDGPEGDDTPEESAGPGNAYFGNPSENYSNGCTTLPFGMMYGSFMNYFDDRALFMFSDGYRKRVEDCIDLYRPGLLTSDGAMPPVDVTDAFMVTVTPRGTPERREYIVNNTPFTATVRNTGTGNLTSVTINAKLDGVNVGSGIFQLALLPGSDTTLSLAPITGSAGAHTITVYTSAPNGTTDAFLNNDTLQSFIFIQPGVITIPFTENFTSATFPPAGWQIWNPSAAITWTRDAASGFTLAGAATVQNRIYQNGYGQFDDLITPAFDVEVSDSTSLSFDVAYAVYNMTDVSLWDGLEVYVSGDGGFTYNLAYKKTGNQLKTIGPAQVSPFVAAAGQPALWRTETIDLTHFAVAGKKMLVKFRNTCAFGNNLYIDDISIKGLSARDAYPIKILNLPTSVCSASILPTLVFGTNGVDTLKTLLVNYTIDNGTVYSINWTGSLGKDQTADFVIGPITGITPGNHILTLYTSSPNGLADQFPSNDTINISFSILQSLALPVVEGFESSAFPPSGWALINPDGGFTWVRTTNAGKSGVGSLMINAYDYGTVGEIDILRSQSISLERTDSLNINFDVAYEQYVAASKDSLAIVYSVDCGATWLPTAYHKGGAALSTVNGALSDDPFIPDESQWRNESLTLSTCNINSPAILIGIKSINDNGNNIYVDNFSISKVDAKQNNAAVLSINKPFFTVCAPGLTQDFTPEVTIANYGFDTLKTLTINYQVDNGTVGAFSYSGALPKCETQVVTLNPITSGAGDHLLTVFSTDPNVAADQFASNDTATKAISISTTTNAPVTEGFETTAFPPLNWNIQNTDGLLTWERTTSAAKTGIGAVEIRNYDYPVANTIDELISPVIKYDAAADSFFVSFDYAYAQGIQYPGSTQANLDTLEVQVTQDCGQTFNPIWKKWGEDLQTINDPNQANGSKFTPNGAQWKNINLYLNPVINSKDFQLYFAAKGNKQNNLYIDNINIYTKVLPKRLRDQGYLIYPNPFKSSFLIHNYQVPTTLQSVGVYNSVGQLVWLKVFDGTASTEITVDLGKLAAGVYVVKLKYVEKTVVERIVKQ